MDINTEFVEQLEEIDNYTIKHKNNNLTAIVLKQIRQDFIDSYIASMSTLCEHNNLVDEGCFNYKNNMFIEETSDKAKYHKFFCPTCRQEIILENNEKALCLIK